MRAHLAPAGCSVLPPHVAPVEALDACTRGSQAAQAAAQEEASPRALDAHGGRRLLGAVDLRFPEQRFKGVFKLTSNNLRKVST